MRQVEQLELPLWQVLKEATVSPEEADLRHLLDILDASLSGLDSVGQLQVAAEAIVQIVQVFQEQSTITFEELEATVSEEGPIMPEDAFDRYVRQTMEVDFEQFIEPLESSSRHVSERQTEADTNSSVAGELNKAALLQALDEQMSQEPELNEAEIFNRTLAIAHEEDVSEWVTVIAQWMKQQSITEVSLLQCQKSIGMPLIQLWLALLLGGYPIEQRGDFYETQQVWIVGLA